MRLRVLLLITSFLSATFSNGQQPDSVRSGILVAALDIISNTTTCALITRDEKGNPHVRTMDPFAPETDFTIWLATNPKSRKVAEIRKNQHVTLYYSDKEDKGYVTIQGTAQIVNDQKEKDKRWKEAWNDFYPNRKEGYLLIKVTPSQLEVINYRWGISGNPGTWEPARVTFK